MRLKIAVAVSALLLTSKVLFAADPGPFVHTHSISLGAGGVFPYAKLDTGPLGAGDQQIGSSGFSIGGRYLYASNPRIDIGLGLESWSTGEKSFLITPAVGELSMKSTMFMVLAKMHPSTTNNFVPYFLGGLGIHVSQFDFDLSPAPGYVWSSGNPTETRSIISDKKAGLALSLGVGVDYNITKSFFMAIEGRLDVISKEKYDATTYGQSIGFINAETGATNGVFQVRIGQRFGWGSDGSGDEIPEAPKSKTEPAKVEGAM